MANLLFEVTVLDGSTPKTLRMSAASSSSAGTQLDGEEWPNLITKRHAPSGNWSDQGLFTQGEINHGSISFRLSASHENEHWSAYEWNGAIGRLFVQTGDEGDWSAYTQEFEGSVSSLDRQGSIATIGLLGPDATLNTELLSSDYAGTGNAEGLLERRGEPKPICIGTPRSVEPVLVDPARQIYQVHAYSPVKSIAIYEFAQALDPAKAKGDHPNYAALANLALVPGEWATCNALGMFRLGGTPSKKVSADVVVDARKANEVIRDLLILAGVPAAKIAPLFLTHDGPWSLYQTSQITIGEVARLAAYHAGGVLYADGLGTWRVIDYAATKAPITLKADRSAAPLVRTVRELNSAPPVWKVKVGYDPCFGVHSTNDISPLLLDTSQLEGFEEALEEVKDAAEAAAASAAIAIGRLESISNDNVLDRADKSITLKEYQALFAERAGIISKAVGLGITTEKDAYEVRNAELDAYLNGLSPAYTDFTQDTPINGAEFRGKFNAVYAARQALVNRMVEVSATKADWSGVSGPNKPQDNATVGAPNGTPVGDKTAEQVVDAITNDAGEIIRLAQLQADIETAKQIADELKETYGDAVVAKASADAAKLAEANAKLAADNAAQAKQDAQAAFTGADGARQAAIDNANLAYQRSESAAGAANAAAGSAATANTRADDAGREAQAASAHAVTAGLEAGKSQGSANAAASSAQAAYASEGNAGIHASAAASSAVTATTAAQGMLSSTFNSLSAWTQDWGQGTGSLENDESRFAAYDHGTRGRVLEVRNNPNVTPHIASKNRITLVRDKVYRITVMWVLAGQQANEVSVNANIFGIGIRPDSAVTGSYYNPSQAVSIVPGQAGWGTAAYAIHEFDVHSNWYLDQGAQWLRPMFRIESQGIFVLKSIELRDYTAEYHAKGSADAAALSYSNAAASETKAGQSASAAAGSALNASTAEGSAKSYRDEAVRSEQNASGSAQTASQQAGLAAGSAGGAAGSASAAAGSAWTASSKADEASSSAQASQTSSVRASSAALDATSKSTGNIIGRATFDATSGQGSWSGAGQVVYDAGVNAYILQQTNRDCTEGAQIPGNWSNRRFRIFGRAAAWRAYRALIGLETIDNNGNQGFYFTEARPAWSGYGDFYGEILLPDNLKSARPILVSDGPWNAGDHGVNWQSMRIEDITNQTAAKAFADAASSSWSNASYEAGEAGKSASAASGHANTASQQAGAAAGSASAAAGSAATATDRASAAASSATLAATFSTGGGNLLSETSFELNVADWNFYSATGGNGFQWGRDVSGDLWRPVNEHNIGICQQDGDSSRGSQWHTPPVAVQGDRWYEFSAYLAVHRCQAHIRAEWFDTNNNWLMNSWSTTATGSYGGGQDLNSWFRSWAKVKVPANAARAIFVFVKEGTLPGHADSYAWMVRPMLRETYEQANGPSPYAPGSNRATSVHLSAAITETNQVIATANSTLASLQTVIQSGSPNLVRNGGFDQGLIRWNATHSGWVTHTSGGWGRIAGTNVNFEGHNYLESERIPCFGGQAYTLTADSAYFLYDGSGHSYTEIVWWDGNGNYISQDGGQAYAANHDFTLDGHGRRMHKLTVASPSNAMGANVRLVAYKSGGTLNSINWRQVKFEAGMNMTTYSNEASVTNLSETVTSIDGKANTALARAAVRLDVNGYVTGWEANNNGSTGNMVINADHFAIQKPGGGARTEYSGGNWRVYNGNGNIVVRMGVW